MMHRTTRRAAIAASIAALFVATVVVPVGATEPLPEGGAFIPAGNLAEARTRHTATLLPDGSVLVIGGRGAADRALASAELWNPVTRSFSPAGSLAEARHSHTATLLPSGQVLVIGGTLGEGSLASAELWDPITGSFVPAGSLKDARGLHTATLLGNGNVLVVGGSTRTADGAVPLASSELWDPTTRSFKPAGVLAEARAWHTATLLPDGTVLVIGGAADSPLTSAELYDPVAGSFATTGSLAEARSLHTATPLARGRVLIVGGYHYDSLDSVEIYEAETGSVSSTGSLSEARSLHTATVLPDGRTLVIGGDAPITDEGFVPVGSAELYDPTTGSFTPTGSLAEARSVHTATLLPDGSVLAIGGGGTSGDVLGSAELWKAGPPRSRSSSAPSATQTAAAIQTAPASQTAADTQSPPATVDPMMAALRLMNLPPAGIMESCRPSSPSLDGQLAVVVCSFGADTVVYASFDGVPSLTAAFDALTGVPPADGAASCREGPFKGTYPGTDGTEAGQVACATGPDGPVLAWTDDGNLVFGLLQMPVESEFADLHDHWLEVRLDATSAAEKSPAPAATDELGTIRQWAAEATASSQYTSTDWSAAQAVGEPDAPGYGQYPTSWAPLVDPGEPEWLELTYDMEVVPSAVEIWEANGAGFVVRVEAFDDATGGWLTLWQGTDPTPEQWMAFSPPLAATDIATRRIPHHGRSWRQRLAICRCRGAGGRTGRAVAAQLSWYARRVSGETTSTIDGSSGTWDSQPARGVPRRRARMPMMDRALNAEMPDSLQSRRSTSAASGATPPSGSIWVADETPGGDQIRAASPS